MKVLSHWEAVLVSYTKEKQRWDRIYPWISHVLRPVSFLITIPFLRRGITANQVTALTAILGLASCGLLTWGIQPGFVWGGICVTLLNLFDCVDGNLARLKPSNGPPVGKFYDQLVGDIFPLIYFFLGVGLARADPNRAVAFLIAGGATTILRFMVVLVRSKFRGVLETDWEEARALGQIPRQGHAFRWYTKCYYNATDIQGHDFLLWVGAFGGWLPYFLAGSLLVAAADFCFTLMLHLTRAVRLQSGV